MSSRKRLEFSIIPYASVTTIMVQKSTFASRDDMPRTVRGDDELIVVYDSLNRSTYSDYFNYNYKAEYGDFILSSVVALGLVIMSVVEL